MLRWSVYETNPSMPLELEPRVGDRASDRDACELELGMGRFPALVIRGLADAGDCGAPMHRKACAKSFRSGLRAARLVLTPAGRDIRAARDGTSLPRARTGIDDGSTPKNMRSIQRHEVCETYGLDFRDQYETVAFRATVCHPWRNAQLHWTSPGEYETNGLVRPDPRNASCRNFTLSTFAPTTPGGTSVTPCGLSPTSSRGPDILVRAPAFRIGRKDGAAAVDADRRHRAPPGHVFCLIR